MNNTTALTFYRKKPQGQAESEINKMKVEKNGELMSKAIEINSKFNQLINHSH